MPVADTSFVVDLIRHDESAMACLRDVEDEGRPIAITPVTVLELFAGAYSSASVAENIRMVQVFRAMWEELPFTDEVYHAFGCLSAALSGEGIRIGDLDEVLAAFALCYDSAVISRDRHFRKVKSLSVIPY